MHKFILVLMLFYCITSSFAQKRTISLWQDITAMEKEKTKIHVFTPPDSIRNGASVIICPGGSYYHTAGIRHEGFEVAEWFVSKGITAFVLSYRVNNKGYHHPAMIQDLQRAIQWVRERYEEYKISKTGVLGFSAGGHLALMAGTFYNENYLEPLGIKTDTNLKPDFIVAVYPVVSMQDSLTHERSRKSFFGSNYNKEMLDKFSIELQVKPDMPPVFLTTTKDDGLVNCQNSIVLEKALIEQKVKHKFVLYEKGGHGYGLHTELGGEAATFNELLLIWLYEIGIIK